MKKFLLLFLLIIAGSTVCYADDVTAQIQPAVAPQATSDVVQNEKDTVVVQDQQAHQDSAVVSVSDKKTLKKKKKTAKKQATKPEADKLAAQNPKIDLKAVFLEPHAKLNAQAIEENREMTEKEQIQYNIHEALYGEVEAIRTKGLLEDKTKMTFEKGPIKSITPWASYIGYTSDNWKGPAYANTLYGFGLTDVGMTIKMRDNKTLIKMDYNVVNHKNGNNYMQDFCLDNYVQRDITKNNKLLVGYARTAVGYEGSISPYELPLITRAQISRNLGNTRSLGAKWSGKYKYADYSLGMYSSGRYFHDWFPGPEMVSWVNVKPLEKAKGKYGHLTVGTGLSGGKNEESYFVSSSYLNYEYKRLQANVEYANADGSNGSSGFTTNKSDGVFATALYRLTPRIQLLGRWDTFDPNKNKSGDRRTEYTAGLNYFIKGKAMKLMVNYVFYQIENGTYGTQILAGTQIRL